MYPYCVYVFLHQAHPLGAEFLPIAFRGLPCHAAIVSTRLRRQIYLIRFPASVLLNVALPLAASIRMSTRKIVMIR